MDHYEGSILFDWIDKNKYSSESILSQISYISQGSYIFNDTLRFNLTLSYNYSDEQIYEVLSRVNLKEFVSQLPLGLDTIMNDSGRNISGGQRQRIAIARALLQNKNIFIVDEGTSALDQKNAKFIEKFFFENPDYTVIFITHHLSEEMVKTFEKIYTI